MLRTLRRQSAKVLPSNSRVRRRRTSSPLQGPPGPRPVRGLRTLLTRKVQVRIPSVLCEGKEPAGIRSAMRAVRRLTQLRCWVVPGRDSSSSAGSVRRVPSLHSAVRLRRVYPSLLYLHTSAGKNPARSVPGRQGAAVPAAGADSVSLFRVKAVAQTATDCAGGLVQGLTARSVLLSFQEWVVRPRPRRASAHTRCPSLSADGSQRSPVRCPAKASRPHTSRPSPGPRSTRFARSAPYGTGRLTAAAQGHRYNLHVCETASTIGLPRGTRPNLITTLTDITCPKGCIKG